MDPVCSEPWSYSEVQTFLQIIGDEEVQRSLYGAVRNGKVFRQVSERMAARGFYRSPDQCRIKCKKLRCEYRKAKLQNEQSAANRKTWKWFNLMDAYFGHRTAFVGLEGEFLSRLWQQPLFFFRIRLQQHWKDVIFLSTLNNKYCFLLNTISEAWG